MNSTDQVNDPIGLLLNFSTDIANQTRNNRNKEEEGTERCRRRCGSILAVRSPDQVMVEIIFNGGMYPSLCLIGLLACAFFWFLMWKRKRDVIKFIVPIIISIFDALYLSLTIIIRFDKFLGLFAKNSVLDITDAVVKILQISANSCLMLTTSTLVFHGLECTWAVLRPLTYRANVKGPRFFAILLVVNLIFLILIVTSENVPGNFQAFGLNHSTYHSIFVPIYYSLFHILPTCVITVCYFLLIRNIRNRNKNISLRSERAGKDNRLTNLLLFSSTLYFILLVPVNVIKSLLVNGSLISRLSLTFWTINIIRESFEIMYACILIYLLQQILHEGCCCRRRAQPRNCARAHSENNVSVQKTTSFATNSVVFNE